MRKELPELRQQYGELEAKYKKVVNELQEGKCSIKVILALKLTCINLKPQQPVITYKCKYTLTCRGICERHCADKSICEINLNCYHCKIELYLRPVSD